MVMKPIQYFTSQSEPVSFRYEEMQKQRLSLQTSIMLLHEWSVEKKDKKCAQ